MNVKLAINGGVPVRREFLPFHKPLLGEDEEKEVIATLRSGWLTTSSRAKEFERKFEEFTGAKYAVALNSCTAGLHLALLASGIGHGDEVITTPLTFAATVNVIENVGAKPVFVDICEKTLNLDADLLEGAITARTKAIMPVHFNGFPCEMDEIQRVADKYNLIVIEDAAHALEARYKGKKIGSISPATVFSFYANKAITTGEGGMITLNDPVLEEKIRVLSLHGISRDAWQRYSESGYKHWDIIAPGFKYNMPDILAALGLCQLDKADSFYNLRKTYYERYMHEFNNNPYLKLLDYSHKDPETVPSYYMFIIQVIQEELKADRDMIMNAIQKENIGIGIHFRPVHLMTYYKKKYGYSRGSFPNAEYAGDRVISLPLYPQMNLSDLNDVVETVNKVLQAFQ